MPANRNFNSVSRMHIRASPPQVGAIFLSKRLRISRSGRRTARLGGRERSQIHPAFSGLCTYFRKLRLLQ